MHTRTPRLRARPLPSGLWNVAAAPSAYTQTVEDLRERASYDSGTVEQQKRKIEDEKQAVIESIQQMAEECKALDDRTADVRVQIGSVADELKECVTNRDVTLPKSECAAATAQARVPPPRALV